MRKPVLVAVQDTALGQEQVVSQHAVESAGCEVGSCSNEGRFEHEHHFVALHRTHCLSVAAPEAWRCRHCFVVDVVDHEKEKESRSHNEQENEQELKIEMEMENELLRPVVRRRVVAARLGQTKKTKIGVVISRQCILSSHQELMMHRPLEGVRQDDVDYYYCY